MGNVKDYDDLAIKVLDSMGIRSLDASENTIRDSLKLFYKKYRDYIVLIECLDSFTIKMLDSAINNLTSRDVIDWIFYRNGHSNKKKGILNLVMKYYIGIQKQCDSSLDPSVRDYYDLHEEEYIYSITGRMLASSCLPLWLKTKQIYNLDKDFVKALAFTDNLQLSKDMVEHLPYNYFYIDISDAGYYYKGAFVNIFPEKDEFKTTIILCGYVGNDVCNVCNEWGFSYNEDGTVDINTMFEDSDITELFGGVAAGDGSFFLSKEQEKHRNIINNLCFQILCYLSSSEPDIYEKPLSKGNHRPSKKYIKNDYDDITINEVGTRYGSEYRKEVKRYIDNIDTGEERDSHRTVTPHLRRAHWSHYWVGKGRTKCVTRWIQPTFVVGNPKDAVLHKVS